MLGLPLPPFGSLWGALGLPWGALGLLWDPLGLPWDALGLIWGALGLPRNALEFLWVRLGLFWAPSGVLGDPGGGPPQKMWLKYRACAQDLASGNLPGGPGGPGGSAETVS